MAEDQNQQNKAQDQEKPKSCGCSSYLGYIIIVLAIVVAGAVAANCLLKGGPCGSSSSCSSNVACSQKAQCDTACSKTCDPACSKPCDPNKAVKQSCCGGAKEACPAKTACPKESSASCCPSQNK